MCLVNKIIVAIKEKMNKVATKFWSLLWRGEGISKFQIRGSRSSDISLKMSLQDYDFEKSSFDMRKLSKDF